MKKLCLGLLSCLFASLTLAQSNANLQLRSHLPYPKACSDIWGYVDTLGNEYALVGTWEGVSIVNVTNPDTPKIVKNIPSFSPANGGVVYREIKTWNKHAYVTTDYVKDSGLLIIDLSHLPDTDVTYHNYSVNGFTTAHTLWIDEHGILYAYGFNTLNGLTTSQQGAMLFDLKQNSDKPNYISQFNGQYLHDGFVRGDTLWAAEIYQDALAIYNVKDSSSFKSLGNIGTNNRVHNAWPTTNNHVVFITDEQNNSSLSAFNVSNLDNISILGEVQSNPGSGSSVHNVILLNDTFAVTSYYTDGVVIFDVSRPTNMVEVGNFDTSPFSGVGIPIGCWGVYPFLPSHNIIASDVEEGLFVFSPHYKHACWLEGNVNDSLSGLPLDSVSVKILPAVNGGISHSGSYRTGTPDSGVYDVQFALYGYATKTVHNVHLQNGKITNLNILLVPDTAFNLAIIVEDSANNPIKNAKVWITDNFQYSKIYTTDATGTANVLQLYTGKYDIYATAWGYHIVKLDSQLLILTTPAQVVKIAKGYYDDFTFDLGWHGTGTAASGLWMRTKPEGITNNGVLLNPPANVPNKIGELCYLTGNGNSNSLGVIHGTAVLTSPVFDLSSYTKPTLTYYKWFADYNSRQAPNDSLVLTLSNGATDISFDVSTPGGEDSLSTWVYKKIDIKSYLPLTTNMTLTLSTSESVNTASSVVAGLDNFEITDTITNAIVPINQFENKLTAYPNPFSGNTTIYYSFKVPSPNRQLILNDLSGRILFQQNITNNFGALQLNNELEAGMYLISVTEDGKRLNTIKVVKY